jgi:hypothetical protein
VARWLSCLCQSLDLCVEVWGLNPTDSTNILNTITKKRGATWQPMFGPRGTVQPTKNCHVSQYHSSKICQLRIDTSSTSTSAYGLPRHRTTSATSASVQTVQSTHIFFACLTIRTERDISLIRRPFEPKRVALGS